MFRLNLLMINGRVKLAAAGPCCDCLNAPNTHFHKTIIFTDLLLSSLSLVESFSTCFKCVFSLLSHTAFFLCVAIGCISAAFHWFSLTITQEVIPCPDLTVSSSSLKYSSYTHVVYRLLLLPRYSDTLLASHI